MAQRLDALPHEDAREASPGPCFDLDVLRTLVFAVELGGFARAARRVGRSQSAVSLQMRRLEGQAGQSLFAKAGRSFALTPAGELMLGYARRMLAVNDEALADLRGVELARPLRLGLLPDFAETWLPELLAQFVRAHPGARLEARVSRNRALIDALDRGRLDLALVFGVDRPSGTRIADLATHWIARRGFRWPTQGSLPLVAFEAPCVFRSAAIDALDRAGIRWHIAFTSQSLAGVWAAAEAGLGVTVRVTHGMPAPLDAVAQGGPVPALPKVGLWLHEPPVLASPLVAELRELLERSLAAVVRGNETPAVRARRSAGGVRGDSRRMRAAAAPRVTSRSR